MKKMRDHQGDALRRILKGREGPVPFVHFSYPRLFSLLFSFSSLFFFLPSSFFNVFISRANTGPTPLLFSYFTDHSALQPSFLFLRFLFSTRNPFLYNDNLCRIFPFLDFLPFSCSLISIRPRFVYYYTKIHIHTHLPVAPLHSTRPSSSTLLFTILTPLRLSKAPLLHLTLVFRNGHML